MASTFQSFDRSPLGAFIRSPLGARGAGEACFDPARRPVVALILGSGTNLANYLSFDQEWDAVRPLFLSRTIRVGVLLFDFRDSSIVAEAGNVYPTGYDMPIGVDYLGHLQREGLAVPSVADTDLITAFEAVRSGIGPEFWYIIDAQDANDFNFDGSVATAIAGLESHITTTYPNAQAIATPIIFASGYPNRTASRIAEFCH